MPIAAHKDLFPKKPSSGPNEGRVVRRKPGILKGEHREPGIPHWRDTGLQAKTALVLDAIALKARDPPREDRRLKGVAKRI